MWWLVRSAFHKYATALTVYWIPVYAEVMYIRVGFLVLQYHLTCLCSLITHNIYFYTTLRPNALQAGRSRVRYPMVSLEFFIDVILPTALWPWGRLSF